MSKETPTSAAGGAIRDVLSKTVGALVVVGVAALTAWLGIDRFIERPERRAKLADEFLSISTEYVDFAKKTWNDVSQRGYDDTNKSKNQRRWEDELWSQFQVVVHKAERECQDPGTRSAMRRLRCANRKYYSLYEVVEEGQMLYEVVDLERLQNDCGTSSWSLLNQDISSKSLDLQSISRKLYGDLTRSRKQASEAVNKCAGL